MSVQVGKTYKIIGTLYIILNRSEEAREYLLRCLRIFEARGLMRLMKEALNKLKMLSNTSIHGPEATETTPPKDSPEAQLITGSSKYYIYIYIYITYYLGQKVQRNSNQLKGVRN